MALNLFASKEEIAAASPEEREAHYRRADQLVDHPEEFGMTKEPEIQRQIRDDQFDHDEARASGEIK